MQASEVLLVEIYKYYLLIIKHVFKILKNISLTKLLQPHLINFLHRQSYHLLSSDHINKMITNLFT